MDSPLSCSLKGVFSLLKKYLKKGICFNFILLLSFGAFFVVSLFWNFGSLLILAPPSLCVCGSTLTAQFKLERLCTNKRNGCSKLGVKHCHRNVDRETQRLLQMNSAVLCYYSILVATVCFSYYSLSACNANTSLNQYKLVFHKLHCWSIIIIIVDNFRITLFSILSLLSLAALHVDMPKPCELWVIFCCGTIEFGFTPCSISWFFTVLLFSAWRTD